MNQSNFGQDINVVPAAAVYPTAGGGTSAGAAMAMSPQTNVSISDGNGGSTTVVANPLPTSKSTVWYWLGFLGLLLALVVVARKAGSDEDFRNIKPTFYNFIAVTLTAIVGITGLKVLASKFPVPGASDVILAA